MKSKNNINLIPNQSIIISQGFTDFRVFLNSITEKTFKLNNFLEIIYVINGSISIKNNNRLVDLKNSDLFILNIDGNYEINPTNDEDNILLVFQIKKEYIREFISLGDNEYFTNSLDQDVKFRIIKIIARLFMLKLSNEEDQLKLINSEVDLGKLLRLLKAYKDYKTPVDNRDIYNIVMEITRDISNNYSTMANRNINLEYFSGKYKISYYYLSRSFKEIIGKTYTELILDMRLNKAIDQLLNTQGKIVDIAYLSGFNNLKSFNKSFKDKFQVSPSEFRENFQDVNALIKSSELYRHPATRDFLEAIDKLARDKKYFKQNINYQFDFKGKSLFIQEDWTRVIDINSVLDIKNSLNNILTIFDNAMINRVIFNLRLDAEDTYLLDRYGEAVEINQSIANKLINKLNYLGIEPLIFIEYDFSMDIGDFLDLVMKNINFVSSIINLNNLSKYSFGIKIPNILHRINDNNISRLVELFNKFSLKLKEKSENVKYNMGIYFGNIYNNRDLKKVEYIYSKLPKLDLVLIDLVYSHTSIEPNQAIDYYLSLVHRLSNIFKKSNETIELISNFEYIGDNIPLKDQDKIYYMNLFLIYYVLKSKGNNHRVSLINGRLNKHDGAVNEELLRGYFYNNLGIKLVDYYLSRFIKALEKNLIYIENGVFATRDHDNMAILLYDNYENFYEYQSGSMNNQDMKDDLHYKFRINNAYGTYKIIIYKISLRDEIIKDNNLIKIYKNSINLREKFYLEKRSMPDIDIDFVEADGQIELSISKKLLDLCLLQIMKI